MRDPQLIFEGCWERLRRADFHRNAIADGWNELVQSEEFYDASAYVESDGKGRVWIEQAHPIPSVIGLELGEFLYQLRSALDGAVFGCAILDSGVDPPPDEKLLEFPICSTEPEFKNSGRKIRPLKQERRDIIKSVQPCYAPALKPEEIPYNFNLAIEILNDWARKDRHRRLHLVGSWASRASPMLSLPPGVAVKRLTVRTDGFLEHDSEIATFELQGWKPKMQIQANPNLVIDIAVDEIPSPRSGNDTLGLRLTAMHKAVAQIVWSLEKSF